MHNASLRHLAHLAGYDLTMTCDRHSVQALVLSRNGGQLTFLDRCELIAFLREQVDLMIELADLLG